MQHLLVEQCVWYVLQSVHPQFDAPICVQVWVPVHSVCPHPLVSPREQMNPSAISSTPSHIGHEPPPSITDSAQFCMPSKQWAQFMQYWVFVQPVPQSVQSALSCVHVQVAVQIPYSSYAL